MTPVGINQRDVQLVLAFLAIALVATAGFYLYMNPTTNTTFEDTKNFVIKAFQNGKWAVMDNYTLYADEINIGNHPELLIKYENGWYRFPGELRSLDGPWKYDVYCWYNENTDQTHIQTICENVTKS